MFKTDSRKGIATLAAAALALFGVVGAAPAQAAVGLNVEPLKGTTYTVPVNSNFDIKVYTDGISTDLITQLKFRIESSGGVEVLYQTATGSAGVTPVASALGTASTSNVVSATTSAVLPTVLSLKIKDATYTSASATIKVTAFLDANSDDLANDAYAATPVDVVFLDGDDITWTTEFATPVLGGTSMDAFVSSTNVNMQAITPNVFFTFEEAQSGTLTASSPVTASYSVTDAKFKATATSASFRVGGNTSNFSTSGTISATSYTATAEFGGTFTNTDVTNGVAVGTKITRVVGATTVARVEGITASATTTNTGNEGNRVTVSPTATTLKLTALAATGSAGVKDQVVTFTVTEVGVAGMDVASTLTVGTQVIRFTNAGVASNGKFTVTTDAKGVATLDIAIAGVKKTNTFTIQASVPGVAAPTATTVTFVEAGAASVSVLDMIGTTPVLVVAKDAAFSLNFAVLDTYGALVTGAGHSVQVTDGSATLSGAVVAGKAVVNWPGYTTTGARTLTASVLKNGAATTAATDTVAVTVGTAGVPSAVSQTETAVGTATAGLALNTKVWANADVRLGDAAPEVTGGVTLTGKVTNAAGAGVAGVDVTVAGAGLQFNSQDELYRTDSITVRTNVSGDYSVVAYSNLAGKKTATITAGTATKTQDVFFTTAAYNTGATLTITTTAVNDTVAPGTTVRATVKLVDKFGNAVKVANQTGTASFGITVAGPGFVSSVPTETNASGEAAVSVLLGSQDSGSLVFTATYDGDDTGTTLVAISATRTITIGAAAPAVPASDQKLTVGSFKGFVAIYALNYTGQKLSAKVAGKWLVVNSLIRFERVVRNTGAAIPIVVDLYIDGKFVRTENIVTK